MNLKNSTIPARENLEKVFAEANTQIDKAKKNKENPNEHLELVKQWSMKIRRTNSAPCHGSAHPRGN
jgi:hypothetical protein